MTIESSDGAAVIARPCSFAKCSTQMKQRCTERSLGLPAAVSAGTCCSSS